MKKFCKYLFLGLSLASPSVASIASTHEPTVQIRVCEDPDIKEEPNRGKRIPSSPIECTIDFQNLRIELSSTEYINSFEVWDEEGVYPIASYDYDSEFVDFLSGLSGVYQIQLVGEEHVYIGYIEL